MHRDPGLRKVTFTALILLIGAVAGCGGGDGSGEPTPVPKSLLAACPTLPPPASAPGSVGAVVDGLVQSEMQSQGLPSLTIEIAKAGTVVYAQAYGYADLNSCRAAQVSTPYQIGSVTKQFTATLLLQLQEAGQLDLDRPLAQYLPSYAFDPRIALRMLLNQTSGLDDYLTFPKPSGWTQGISEQTVLPAIASAPLLFTPGSAYAYSNSNYYVLGAVIEAVTGSAYETILDASLLTPLKLSSTAYREPSQAAMPYSYGNPVVAGSKGVAAGIVPDSSVFFAAGALWSNVSDLATWDEALFGGLVLTQASLALMTTPPASVPAFQTNVNSPYAMGWLRGSIMGRPFVWHNGQDAGFHVLQRRVSGR